MPAERSLVCPKCSTLVSVAPMAIPLMDEASGEPAGAVLKRCPECLAWSWMTAQRQPAS